MKVCANCNEELRNGVKFCNNCGTPVPKDAIDTAPETKTKSKPLPVFKAVNIRKKTFLFGAMGIAAVAVIAIIIALLAGGKNRQDNYLLYLKDKEIFYSDLGRDLESWQLTSHLIYTDDVETGDLANSRHSLGMLIHMSNDGKLLFFPEKINSEDVCFNLYYRDITDKNAVAIRIDSDVISYSVDESAKVVTYLKGEEGSLYQYTLKTDSKNKIASDVTGFQASDDGKKIGYMNSEGSIYLRYMDEDDKEKIASDAEKLIYLTEDFKTVYYMKENALYKQTEGKDKAKIASDVSDVLKVYDSGEIYFTKSNVREISLTDYVDDDMKDADADLTAPTRPSLPSWWDYNTTDEYNKAYDEYKKAYDAYADAYETYIGKQQRDSIRVALKNEVIEHTDYTLYYFNGEETSTVTENFAKGYSDYCAASDTAVLIYASTRKGSVKKVKLSELSGAYEAAEKVRQALSANMKINVAIKDNSAQIEQKDANNFRINSTGTLIYFLDNIPENGNHGELYSIPIKGDNVGEPELYDEDVYIYSFFLTNDTFLYFKDYNEDSGDLYIGKKLVDYDVRIWSLDYNTDTDTLIYFTDWNSEKQYGTLKLWNGKETVKVADDAHEQYMLSDGRILYLYDYSTEYSKGELRIWEDGESKKIDDEVVYIIPAYADKHKGITND